MGTEKYLPPNYPKLDIALRSIGYSFEVAVADIIDNSIDAEAKKVLVRLITRKDGLLDLVVWDNGYGMSEKTLEEAMRFGADVSQKINRLGKFGLGMKLASLSQAKELRVVSSRGGKLSGRAWLEDGIAKGFILTTLDTGECRQMLSRVVPKHPVQPSATVVQWSNLYRVGRDLAKPQLHAQKLKSRLEGHLELAFHRFLSGRPRKVKIAIDIFDEVSQKVGLPGELDPLDPFDYDSSGHSDFPARLSLDGLYKESVKIRAHIWPPNSGSPQYKLPGGANARQGFYFYRNDRLIQGGGWNGMPEAEPHSSLARLEVDMHANFDLEVSLDVKKVEIQLPADLVTSIQKAKTSSGMSFKDYLSTAERTYRTRKLVNTELPLIPSHGLPSGLADFLLAELRIDATSRHRDLRFEWKLLEEGTFFEVEREDGCIYLNGHYRGRLLNGLTASSTDLPVLKSLMFFVLEEVFNSGHLNQKMKKRVNQLNRILAKAVKFERGSE